MQSSSRRFLNALNVEIKCIQRSLCKNYPPALHLCLLHLHCLALIFLKCIPSSTPAVMVPCQGHRNSFQFRPLIFSTVKRYIWMPFIALVGPMKAVVLPSSRYKVLGISSCINRREAGMEAAPASDFSVQQRQHHQQRYKYTNNISFLIFRTVNSPHFH